MPPAVATVRDWSEALLTSFAAALTMLFAAIPKLIGFVLIVDRSGESGAREL
jgi:hypothetical protein